MTRSRAAFLLLAGLVFAVLLRMAQAGPPLYDGIVLPETPYDYCHPPANLASTNTPPTSGTVEFPIQDGKVLGGGIQTDDAQVVVFLGVDALKASANATSVTVKIDPVCQDTPSAPSGLQVLGNVYRISASEQPSGHPLQASAAYRVTMRTPASNVRDVELFNGTSWQSLQTELAPAGNPVVGAIVPKLGDLAVIGHGGQTLLGRLGGFLASFGILALVILFGIIAIVQEVRRRRRKA